MKKHICFALSLVFLFSMISIPAQAQKAGEIKDNIYTDSDYNFSFKVPTGWSASIKKAKYALRVSLDQKSPVPPRHFQGELRDYMQIPSIKVIVDTTSLTVDKFIDSMLDPKFKSKQKKGIMKSLSLISRSFEEQKRKTLTMDGCKATILEARQSYTVEVSKRGTDRAEVINDYKTGAVFFVVREGRILVIHMISEYQTGGPIYDIFGALINSLKFETEPDKPTEDTSG